jgi:hypothetical protein
MLSDQRIAVLLPACDAVQTLRKTFDDIPKDIVDDIILTDDASRDNTVELSLQLGIHTLRHDCNRGDGDNQKTCFAAARARGTFASARFLVPCDMTRNRHRSISTAA